MTLVQAMCTDYPAVGVTCLLTDAARLMDVHRCVLMPVLDAGYLVGTVGALDLAARGVGGRLDPRSSTVRDVLNPSPPHCTPETALEQVLAQMRARRHNVMLVVEPGGRLLGVIDLFRVLDALEGGQSGGPLPDLVRRTRGDSF